ncbi:MAG: hypothetical protein AAF065_07975 [Verrucomicrobiota bacterium]
MITTDQELNLNNFEGLEGTIFKAQVDGDTVELELREVKPHTERDFNYKEIRKQPFSLFFLDKNKDHPSWTGSFALSNEHMEERYVFMEPLEQNEDGTVYQACFG